MNDALDNKLHYKRLKQKNIIIEDVFKKEQYIDDKKKDLVFIRTSNGEKNDVIEDARRSEKRYLYNGKCLYCEKNWDKSLRYTFLQKKNENDQIVCSNCGHVLEGDEIYYGCQYCGSIFNFEYSGMARNDILNFNKEGVGYKILTIVIFCLMEAWVFLSKENILEALFIGIMTSIVYIILSMIIANIILIPFMLLKFNKNCNIDRINKQIKRFGIKPESLYNCLQRELLNYYFDEERSPQYRDLIDFDVLGYKKFEYAEDNNGGYVIVTYNIRKVYFNEKISKTENLCSVKLRRNYVIDITGGKIASIRCKNCGASINVNESYCSYCHTKNDFKNEWSIEEILEDNM